MREACKCAAIPVHSCAYSAEVALAVIEFHAHFMQGAHIFPDNRLCTPFVSNSDHRSLINRILVTGKKYFLMTEKFLPSSNAIASWPGLNEAQS